MQEKIKNCRKYATKMKRETASQAGQRTKKARRDSGEEWTAG